MKFLFALITTILLSLNSTAGPLTFGEPVATGTGCPSGTTTYTLAPDNSSLSILLSGEFSLGALSTGGSSRHFCGFQIPVWFDQTGRTHVSLQSDLRGFHDLSAASGQIEESALYSLEPSDNPEQRLKQNPIQGPSTDTHTHRHQFNMSCHGAQVIHIFVQAFINNAADGYTLDSIDLAEATTDEGSLNYPCNSTAFPCFNSNNGAGIPAATLIAALMAFMGSII